MDANAVMPREISGGGQSDYAYIQYTNTGFSYCANLVAIRGDISIYTASSVRLLAGYKYQYKFYTNTLTNPPGCELVGWK
ncbi:MAG: hypothetical protein EOO92_22465 [Pedobacter sp.]|nr:MAG: hypothetical protein EOO92_22465 [Pedobacter sp.]